MKSNRFTQEDVNRFTEIFDLFKEAFLERLMEVDDFLKERYPGISSDDRLEKAIMICGLILGIE